MKKTRITTKYQGKWLQNDQEMLEHLTPFNLHKGKKGPIGSMDLQVNIPEGGGRIYRTVASDIVSAFMQAYILTQSQDYRVKTAQSSHPMPLDYKPVLTNYDGRVIKIFSFQDVDDCLSYACEYLRSVGVRCGSAMTNVVILEMVNHPEDADIILGKEYLLPETIALRILGVMGLTIPKIDFCAPESFGLEDIFGCIAPSSRFCDTHCFGDMYENKDRLFRDDMRALKILYSVTRYNHMNDRNENIGAGLFGKVKRFWPKGATAFYHSGWSWKPYTVLHETRGPTLITFQYRVVKQGICALKRGIPCFKDFLRSKMLEIVASVMVCNSSYFGVDACVSSWDYFKVSLFDDFMRDTDLKRQDIEKVCRIPEIKPTGLELKDISHWTEDPLSLIHTMSALLNYVLSTKMAEHFDNAATIRGYCDLFLNEVQRFINGCVKHSWARGLRSIHLMSQNLVYFKVDNVWRFFQTRFFRDHFRRFKMVGPKKVFEPIPKLDFFEGDHFTKWKPEHVTLKLHPCGEAFDLRISDYKFWKAINMDFRYLRMSESDFVGLADDMKAPMIELCRLMITSVDVEEDELNMLAEAVGTSYQHVLIISSEEAKDFNIRTLGPVAIPRMSTHMKSRYKVKDPTSSAMLAAGEMIDHVLEMSE
jgi:hypothetical protein